MRNLDKDIVITNTDLERLLLLVEQHGSAQAGSLEVELHRATIVDQRSVPSDVVTMNTVLVYEDCQTAKHHQVTVVYPRDANLKKGRVSVFAPIGSALLGMRPNQTIEWTVPGGKKCLRVVEIRYQPEASGVYDQ